MKPLLLVGLFVLLIPNYTFAQVDSLNTKKLTFTGDFRFRIEQDWNTKKSNETYYDDRSRLRYRLRFGATYQFNEWAEFGTRIRTGYSEKQQDPQLTLGDGFNEFGTVPLGFEKLYFKTKYKKFSGWLGKNTFPFKKQNELFWSDNVYPEGVFVSVNFKNDTPLLENLKINTGHFIMLSSGANFSQDQYFQGIQVVTNHFKNRLTLFPSFYYFNKMPNIPDGNETFYLDYSLFHLGSAITITDKPFIKAEIDYYHNFENFNQNDSITQQFKNQKNGIVASLGIGKLKNRGDWKVSTTFTYLEKYAIVDFLAQNDWTRWDYSSQGSPDGRLSNFKGLELFVGYLIRKNFKINARFFMVEQLVPFGISKETGNRVRLDLDIGF